MPTFKDRLDQVLREELRDKSGDCGQLYDERTQEVVNVFDENNFHLRYCTRPTDHSLKHSGPVVTSRQKYDRLRTESDWKTERDETKSRPVDSGEEF